MNKHNPANKINYYNQLKDPRWQKKRLELMNKANFECEYCGAKDKTLNIHHGYYTKDLCLWEYADKTMHVLCEDCHRRFQTLQNVIYRLLAPILFLQDRVLGYVQALSYDLFETEEIEIFIPNSQSAAGFADYYSLTYEQVIAATDGRGMLSGKKLHDLIGRGDSVD